MCLRVSGSVVDSPPHNPGRKQRGEVPQLCCSHILGKIVHLAWHKRGRFTSTCRAGAQSGRHSKISSSVLCLSVRTFENLLKALQHLFVIFFDDMIEQKKVNQGSHVRLLCYGILWTVSEERPILCQSSS